MYLMKVKFNSEYLNRNYKFYVKLKREKERLTKKLNDFEDKIATEIDNIKNNNLTIKELHELVPFIPKCSSKADLWEYIDEREKDLL